MMGDSGVGGNWESTEAVVQKQEWRKELSTIEADSRQQDYNKT